MTLTSAKRLSGMLAVGFLLAATAVGADNHSGNKATRVPQPQVVIQKGEKCVEPTDVMKRNHMEFILHQRDKTMHQGVRTKQHSLKNCINCHADPKTNSVLGKDGFCESCHTYAAVSIDCFSCHSSSPEEKVSGTTLRTVDDNIKQMLEVIHTTGSSSATGGVQ